MALRATSDPPLPPGATTDPPLPPGATTEPSQSAPAQGDGFDLPILGHQPSLTSFLRGAPTEPGLSGHVARTGLGILQGFAGPFEWGAKQLGATLPEPLKEMKRGAEKTVEGTTGEVVGGFFNPALKAIKPIQALNEIGGPWARAIARIGQSTLAGGIGGAISQPGDTRTQGAWGAGIGAVLGAPGALAAKLGLENAQQLASRYAGKIPIVNNLIDAIKSGGEGAFNRVWYGHSLEPINGKVPPTAGFKGLQSVADQIGNAINKATAGMWLDARPGSNARAAINTTMRVAQNNLLDQNAWTNYVNTIQRLVAYPLAQAGGVFSSAQLKAVSSNLAAAVRNIYPGTEAQRMLRSELDQFRMRLLDNTSGGDRNAYKAARLGWARFARGRDSVPVGSKDGIFSPDHLATEIDRHEPTHYDVGAARDQSIANAAQQALVSPTHAAQGAVAGRSLTQPSDWAGRVAGAAAPQTTRATAPRQPPTYLDLVPGP